MQVDFKIVSYHRLSPEQVSEFSVEDSAIFGRSNSCDWCLPDPEKVVSGSHVRIEKDAGGFYVYDTSTNGVFINRSVEPLGKDAKHRLYSEDLLAIGDYEITVNVIDEKEHELPTSQPNFVDNEHLSQPESSNNEPVEFLAQDILSSTKSAALPIVNNDLNDSFVSPASTNTVAIPEDWDFGLEKDEDLLAESDVQIEPELKTEKLKAVTPRPEVKKEVVIEKAATKPIASTHDEFQKTAPAPAPTKKEQPIQRSFVDTELHKQSQFNNQTQFKAPTQNTEQHAELEMFIKGLGLSKKLTAEHMSEEVYFELGKSMNLMFMGLIKLLRSRALLKSEFKINQTTFQQQENNPLKFSATIDDVFNNLYLHGSSSFLSSEKAIEDVFKDTEKHDKAFSAGTLGALTGILDQLEPEKIEENNQQSHYLDKLIPANKDARSWELYSQLHNDLKTEITTHGSSALTEDFVKAYDEKIKFL